MATPAAATPGPFPCTEVLMKAAKLAMEVDKPIHLDYFQPTYTRKAVMGEEGPEERMLVKSNVEFTSIIRGMFKVGADYIIVTENSIYIVSGNMAKRKLPPNFLKRDLEDEE